MNDNRLFPSTVMFGHAYVPNQVLTKVLTPKDGLSNGTMFPELISPYKPGQSMMVIDYLRNNGGGR